MVGFEQQPILLQLELHMTVAQMVGRAQQIERAAMNEVGAHFEQRLLRCMHQDQRAVLGHQDVAAAHDVAARQEDADMAALAVNAVEAAFLPGVPIECDAGSAFEQHRRQALAAGNQFVDGQKHGSSQ